MTKRKSRLSKGDAQPRRDRLKKSIGEVRAEIIKDWHKLSFSKRVEWLKRHREYFSTLGVLSTAEIPVVAGLSTGNVWFLLVGLGLAGIPLGVGKIMEPRVLPAKVKRK
jgi:hypothetical protein